MNQDLTKQYQEVMNDPDIHFETVREKIDGHRILLVPGFLSEALITAGKFGFGGYFDDQMEWFTRDRIEYIRVSPSFRIKKITPIITVSYFFKIFIMALLLFIF